MWAEQVGGSVDLLVFPRLHPLHLHDGLLDPEAQPLPSHAPLRQHRLVPEGSLVGSLITVRVDEEPG